MEHTMRRARTFVAVCGGGWENEWLCVVRFFSGWPRFIFARDLLRKTRAERNETQRKAKVNSRQPIQASQLAVADTVGDVVAITQSRRHARH